MFGCGRTAVDLGDEAGIVEDVEVASDRHVAAVEELGEVAHADRTATTHLSDDQFVSALRERSPSVINHGVRLPYSPHAVNRNEHPTSQRRRHSERFAPILCRFVCESG